MKSTLFATAVLLSAMSFLGGVQAVEHAQRISTDDYKETWTDKDTSKSTYENLKKQDSAIEFDHHKRPVIGILTEPIRGQLSAHDDMEKHSVDTSRHMSYVPRAHVQFLEQAGVRVVPVDFNLPKDELIELLEQVNGVYLPGDSHQGIINEQYKDTFIDVMMFAEAQALEHKSHFPVFLMGNSLNTYVTSKSRLRGVVTEMRDLKHTNSRVELIEHPDDTFLFNGISREEKQAIFNTAQFFNLNGQGVRKSNVGKEIAVNNKIKPIAVFSSHGIDDADDKFVAIAEGKDMPMFAFTYALEMV